MAKSAARVQSVADEGTQSTGGQARKREPAAAPTVRAATKAVSKAARSAAGPSLKPLLVGAGVGAALVLAVGAMRGSQSRRRSRVIGILGRVALFGLARVIAGRDIRGIASNAVMEGAKVLPT